MLIVIGLILCVIVYCGFAALVSQAHAREQSERQRAEELQMRLDEMTERLDPEDPDEHEEFG